MNRTKIAKLFDGQPPWEETDLAAVKATTLINQQYLAHAIRREVSKATREAALNAYRKRHSQ